MPDVDWTDPCAAAAALRTIYFARLSGQAPTSVKTGERAVEWATASLDALRAELERQEGLCARKSGKRRRFAIRGRLPC